MECKDEWNWNNTALLCGEQYYRTEWYVLYRKVETTQTTENKF